MVSEFSFNPESITRLRGTLIVSSQASPGEPLNSPSMLFALAQSAINGGARGLRLEGVENIAYARKHTNLPIIGLTKSADLSDEERLHTVYITAGFADAEALAEAGADIIALDATQRPRPAGESLTDLIELIHNRLHKPVWADISTFQDGMLAAQAGADVLSTTLSGYTAETLGKVDGPDIELLRQLSSNVKLPVVLEGKVWHPEELTEAFKSGAYAVVVGSAITRPQLIASNFARAIPERS